MSEQDEAARRMDLQQLAREVAAAGAQDECDDPDCACHEDDDFPPGGCAAEVTMTEVYDLDIPLGSHPSGW